MKRSLFFPVLLITVLLAGSNPVSSQGASAGRTAFPPDFPALQTSFTVPEPTARPAPGSWRCYPDGSPDPCHHVLNDVDLLSPSYGWAVGNALLRWDGQQWFKYEPRIMATFNSVSVVSTEDAWAAGYNGIYHWDGDRWKESLPETGHSFSTIDMLSPTDGWAAADEHLYHWDGLTWTHYGGYVGINVAALDMLTAQDGWAVGYGGYLLQWDGRIWNRRPSPLGDEAFSGLAMLSSQNGWATTRGGKILHWNGRAWSIAAQPTTQALVEIAFAAPDDGWAMAADRNFYHFDGSGWKPAGRPTNLSLEGFDVNGSSGWAVGERGLLVRRDGNAWSTVFDPPFGYDLGLAANSPTDVWVYDDRGRLVHWDGVSWQDVPSPQGLSISSLDMLSPTDGWAVTVKTSIHHWDGNSWSPVPSPATYEITDIDMLSDQDGWIAGSQGLLRWNGMLWQEWEFVSLNNQDLEMLSPTEGWLVTEAVGGSDRILHWDGTNWTDTGVSNVYLLDLEARAPDDAWAVGNVVLHWDGHAWQPFPGAPNAWIYAVSSAGPEDVWLTGERGLYHWNGVSWWYGPWTEQPFIADLTVFSPWEGWGISGGAILNYDGPPPALSLSTSDGQPGSTFQVTGLNFPPGYTAEVKANGHVLGTITPDASGSFTFLLKTAQADEGSYFLSATARLAPASMSNTSAVILHLDPDAPLHEQDGDGPSFDLPAGIAYSGEVYLPMVGK